MAEICNLDIQICWISHIVAVGKKKGGWYRAKTWLWSALKAPKKARVARDSVLSLGLGAICTLFVLTSPEPEVALAASVDSVDSWLAKAEVPTMTNSEEALPRADGASSSTNPPVLPEKAAGAEQGAIHIPPQAPPRPEEVEAGLISLFQTHTKRIAPKFTFVNGAVEKLGIRASDPERLSKLAQAIGAYDQLMPEARASQVLTHLLATMREWDEHRHPRR